MAVDLHGRERLLPSQFCTEDNFFSQKKRINNKGSSSEACFTRDVPNRVASCGSTLIQMESAEDECIAELTRRMAQSRYLLQEDEPDAVSDNPKLWGFTGLPLSTLWSPLGSNLGIQRGNGGTWGLFHNATGISDDGLRYHHSKKHPAASLEPNLINPGKNPNVGLRSNRDLPSDQLRVFQFYQLKQQQLLKQNRDSVMWERRGRATQQQQRAWNKPTWTAPPLQPTHKTAGSGMRAIFLTGSESRTGSCGTGVFLPRGIGNPSDSRKKQEADNGNRNPFTWDHLLGCSTVLIPARVAQALKLNFDEMGVVSQSLGSRFSLQHDIDAAAGRRNSLQYPPQNRHWPAPPAMKQQGTGVRQGWPR